MHESVLVPVCVHTPRAVCVWRACLQWSRVKVCSISSHRLQALSNLWHVWEVVLCPGQGILLTGRRGHLVVALRIPQVCRRSAELSS